jgi:hypothetical protein
MCFFIVLVDVKKANFLRYRAKDASGNEGRWASGFCHFWTAGVAKQPDWPKWLKNPKTSVPNCNGRPGVLALSTQKIGASASPMIFLGYLTYLIHQKRNIIKIRPSKNKGSNTPMLLMKLSHAQFSCFLLMAQKAVMSNKFIAKLNGRNLIRPPLNRIFILTGMKYKL